MAALLSLVLLTACPTRQVHVPPTIVSGRADHDGGQFRAVVVVRNDSHRPLRLGDYQLVLRVLGSDRETLATTTAHQSTDGEVSPWDQDRICFLVPDQELRARAAEVSLIDPGGVVLSRFELEPLDGRGEPVPEAEGIRSPAADPDRRPPGDTSPRDG